MWNNGVVTRFQSECPGEGWFPGIHKKSKEDIRKANATDWFSISVPKGLHSQSEET